MDIKQILKEIEQTRQSLIAVINQRFGKLITSLEILDGRTNEKKVEWVVPLASNPKVFNKEKPLAVIIGDERICATTWKMVYKMILTRCCQDPLYNEKLLGLRGIVSGRGRMILSDCKEGMTHPAQIDDGLYTETHYGSMQLVQILVERIMDTIQYDYSDISIVLKNK